MRWLSKIPLIRLLIPFCLGIMWSFYHPNVIHSQIWILLLLSIVIHLIYLQKIEIQNAFHNRWITGVFYFILFLGLGNVIANLKIEKYNPLHFSHYSNKDIHGYIGTIISEPETKPKSIKIVLEIAEIKNDTQWLPATGKCLIYLQRDSIQNIQYGNQISFTLPPQMVKPPANFGEFNYKRYLAHHYIDYQIYLKKSDFVIIQHPPSFSLKKLAIQLRDRLLQNYIFYNIHNEEFAIVSALTLGKKNQLNSDLKQAYSSAGAMHILAVSGLHVGIILLILQFSLSWLKRLKHGLIILNLLLILFIWIYAFISGLSPSVIRAATMFSFLILGQLFHKKSNIYNTLALSAFTILIFDPYMLLEVGFQLSYLAVIGIIYLYPYLYKIFQFKYLIFDKAWSITCVSISAQIATAPLGLLYFHQFPSYFLLSNLIVIPAAFIIIFLAIAFQISTLIPFIASLLSKVLHLGVTFLNDIVHYIQQVPNALITGIDISIIETWLIYLIIICVILWLTQYKNKFSFYAFLFTFILIASQTQEKWMQIHQKQITFYSTGNQFSVEYTFGRNNLFIAPLRLTQNIAKMQFHIFHHWWQKGINKQKTQIRTPNFNAFYFGNTRILIIDNHCLFSPQQLEVFQPHIIYINTSRKINLEYLKTYELSPVLIFGTKTNAKTYDRLIPFCYTHHLKFFSIKKNGAIKVKLNKQLLPQLYIPKNFVE